MSEHDVFLSLLVNNSDIQHRMQCTKQEKEDLSCLIELMGEMTERSRLVGYNSLRTEFFEKIDSEFFRAAIILRIETNSSDFMIQALLPYVLSSEERGKDFIEKLIILYGIQLLTLGRPPILLKMALYSFIGSSKGYQDFISTVNK